MPDRVRLREIDAKALACEMSRRLGQEVRLTALSEMKPSGIAFRVDCKADGGRCFVKLIPPGGCHSSFVAYSACADLPFVPKSLFPEVLSFQGFDLLCLEFLEGEQVGNVEDLSEERFQSLLASYLTLSRALSGASTCLPPRLGEMSDRLMDRLEEFARRTIFGNLAFSGVLSLPREACRVGARGLGVIHNDFHIGNLAFQGAELAAVYDFENMDLGLPCEDFVNLLGSRYANRDLSRAGRRRLRGFLRTAIRLMPWSREDWQLAILLYRLKCAVVFAESRKGRLTLVSALRFRRRDRRLAELWEDKE